MKTFKEVIAKGDSYSIGFQHGLQAKQEVNGTINYYRWLYASVWKKSWEDITSVATRYLSYCKTYFPELVEEIKGIADGSGQDFDSIFAINCQYEISRRSHVMLDCCSVLGVLKPRMKDNKTYICENWDYPIEQLNNSIILKIEKEDLKLIMVTEAGIIGRMGTNNYGIGYVGNTLKTKHVGIKAPVHFLKRSILEQKNTEQIIALLKQHGVASSYNFFFGDDCHLYDYEGDYNNYFLARENNNCLFHTNNFVHEELRKNPVYIEQETENSRIRYRTIATYLEGQKLLTLNDLKMILTDHKNKPRSICKHANEDLPYLERQATLSSIIINVTDHKMMIAHGNPCENKYIEHSFDF